MENQKEINSFIGFRATGKNFENLKNFKENKSKLINELLENHFENKKEMFKTDLKFFENLAAAIKINSQILLVLGEVVVPKNDLEHFQELEKYNDELKKIFKEIRREKQWKLKTFSQSKNK